MTGTLYLCATPIGNLEDMTFRAVRILKEVDLIAAEDTRNSMRLLHHFDIHTKITSYHEYNKYSKGEKLVEKLREGLDVALITDAGTPGISDPGEVLVRLCMDEGICVTSLPGACACVNGLILSGLPTGRFCFEAFLSRDKKEREAVLAELKEETRTIVLYEAPHHLKGTLSDIYRALGDREMSICRELTKKHEECRKMMLSDWIRYYEETEPRGEYVLILSGRDRKELEQERRQAWDSWTVEEHMKYYLDRDLNEKEAMKAVAKDRGVSRREIYRIWKDI